MTTSIASSITFPVLRLQADGLQQRGGTPSLSPATVPGAISDLRAALAWQLVQQGVAEDERHARYLLDPPAGHDAAPIDVRDLLSGTAHAARLRAAAAGGRRPGNAASRVRRLLEALGQHQSATAATLVALPSAWQRVEAQLEARIANEPNAVARRPLKMVLTGVRNLARCAAAHGVTDPYTLPGTPDGLRDLLRSWERKNTAHDMWVLRRASRELAAVDASGPTLPTWETDPDASIAELDATMPTFMRELRAWESVAAVKVSRRVTHHRSPSVHAALRPKTRSRYRYQALQWARAYQEVRRRGLITDIELPADLGLVEAWQRTSRSRAHDSVHLATSAEVEALRAAVRSPNGTPAQNASRPLVLVVVEHAVAQHIIGGGADADDGTPSGTNEPHALPPSAIQMVFAVAAVAERVTIAVHADGSDAEQQFRAIWDPTARLMKAQLAASKDSRQEIGELLKRITLPQMICCVLPWRSMVDLPKRERIVAVAAAAAKGLRASAQSAQLLKRARKAFHGALRRWVVQATLCADPSRIDNVQHARLGREILIDAEWTAHGDLVRINAIASTFRPHDEADVPQTATKNDMLRASWRWSPIIIDYQWAATYLREVWWPAVQRLGLVSADVTMRDAVDAGAIAWLINPTPRSRRVPPVAGAFLSKQLNDVWAEALLEGLRAMGRPDLPDTLQEVRQRWPWVFGPHKIRHLWASYWWGLRGPNGPERLQRHGATEKACGRYIARRATGDVDTTLAQHYVKCESVMLEAARHPANHFDHPSAYHREMDLTWWLGEQIDWASRWRDKGFPLPASMRQAFLAEQLRQRKSEVPRVRRRRESYVLPGQHRPAA
jgi:hypothetical protein